MKVLTLLCGVALTSGAAWAQQDWARFRGPNGSGVVEGPAPDLPLTWSKDEHLRWRTPLPGPGSSSPIVVDGKVFVTCWSGYADRLNEDGSSDGNAGSSRDMKRHLVCVDKATGVVLWERALPAQPVEDPFEGMITEHGYASSTPVSDGRFVFVSLGKSGLFAFDLHGQQMWHASVPPHEDEHRWGSAASPVVVGESVLINALTESGFILAFDKSTGKELWRASGGQPQLSYGTPVLLAPNAPASRQRFLLALPRDLWCIDAGTGEKKWEVAHGLGGDVAPHVLSLGQERAIVVGGNPQQGCVAWRMTKTDEPTPTWRSKNSSYLPLPVHHEGHVYVVNDQGFAWCLELNSGREVYRERVLERLPRPRRGGGGAPFYASPVLVQGRLYCVSRRNGVFVIAAKPTFELLAINYIADDLSQFNASPAVDNDSLYLRSDRFLYAISGESP